MVPRNNTAAVVPYIAVVSGCAGVLQTTDPTQRPRPRPCSVYIQVPATNTSWIMKYLEYIDHLSALKGLQQYMVHRVDGLLWESMHPSEG